MSLNEFLKTSSHILIVNFSKLCLLNYYNYRDAAYLKKTERKQYLIYSCYAWGATLLVLTISLITTFVEGNHYKPGIGSYTCWFRGKYLTLHIYAYLQTTFLYNWTISRQVSFKFSIIGNLHIYIKEK